MKENRDAWELWNTCATQWRIGGMGERIGLDYGAMYQVASTLGVKVTPAVLTKIRCLENAVLAARLKKTEKGGRK